VKIKSFSDSAAIVEFNFDEIGTINNALNEVCNGIHLEGEFDTRMGCTLEQARALLKSIHNLGLAMKNST
jgi:hypothetical protein